MKITLEALPTILFDLNPGDRIFLKGQLGTGKTTFAQALIRRFLENKSIPVPSPTYTYYQSYPKNLYHFDLYRIKDPEELIRIGADEIFDNEKTICLIEWPEILGETVSPTKTVELREVPGGRDISITSVK